MSEELNPAAADQLQAFMQDAARVDRERTALLRARAGGQRLDAEQRARLAELDRQAVELIRSARQQGLLLPGSLRDTWWERTGPAKKAAAGLGLVVGSFVVVAALGFVFISLGFIPIFILALGFVFVLGLIVGREFPYKK